MNSVNMNVSLNENILNQKFSNLGSEFYQNHNQQRLSNMHRENICDTYFCYYKPVLLFMNKTYLILVQVCKSFEYIKIRE